jgi:ubiquitin-like protein Pup
MQAKKVTRPNSTYATEQPAVADSDLLSQLDELLDEVDRVLEENVVAHAYVQKGGQ